MITCDHSFDSKLVASPPTDWRYFHSAPFNKKTPGDKLPEYNSRIRLLELMRMHVGFRGLSQPVGMSCISFRI